ncbi:MAG: Vesicle trafficking between the ER and Golgi [Trizodia sp. TS-e1964]|nr:MAG: Vesicle trafficking between the ER and Golgi [Trizodia sp. TS-e1964]
MTAHNWQADSLQMSISQGQTLRERQIASLENILNSKPDDNLVWKVLVFDNLGRDVISSVLRVNDLRAWGVTVHLNINAQRHAIPDVPVVYLVEPTDANLKLITSDLSRNLYSPAHINFLSSIPRPLLEDFAAQTAAANTSENIAQVFDQYLNFIVGEPDLFSLGMGRDTYWALNSAQTKDEELDAVVDRVNGLGVIPIIRCPKAGAAEMISAKLDRKLRDHILNSKDNLFSSSNQRQASPAGIASPRPVLIVLDRNVDLIPMLSHSWTYQSLVHDVLSMKLNRITVETPLDENNPTKGVTKRSYDLTTSDFFWAKNAGLPFPEVAADIDVELKKYTEDANELTKKTGAASIEDLQNESGTSSSAHHLKAAITLLPELRERKATLDMHMNILSALLQGIKDRQLDNFFQLEENIAKQTKVQILELINDDTKGKEPLDKLRLFIIWFLSTEVELSRAEMLQFEGALTKAGADAKAFAYVKRVREITRMTMMASAPSQPAPQQSDLFRGFSSISNRLTDRLKDGALGANFENLISGVKNFLPVNKDLTITKITESIMDPTSAPSSAIAKTEGYLYFDPRSANARGTLPPASQARNAGGAGMPGGLGSMGSGTGATFGQRRQGFAEAVVFTVGGGSIDEYGNLQEWAKRTSAAAGGSAAAGPRKRVVYGSTEIVNARDFVTGELIRLGGESG